MGMLEPNIMGVTAMKLRNYGSRENQRVYLGVDRGRAHAIAERDQHGTSRSELRNL
jgi:hypothetical protein